LSASRSSWISLGGLPQQHTINQPQFRFGANAPRVGEK
jgi:hypothetical protein